MNNIFDMDKSSSIKTKLLGTSLSKHSVYTQKNSLIWFIT